MASVTLTQLWLNLYSDPSESVQLDIMSAQESDQIPGVVRESTTRRRFFTTGVEFKIIEFVAEFLDRDTTLEKLRTFKSVPLILRDATGRILYGVITTVQVIENPNIELDTVGFIQFRFEEVYGTAEV
jgi:hypothetical protein